MSRLAIIPARGGSKRIPNKNIKSFCGKPIISYSISAAQSCGLFDHIMVSTDSQKIADIAMQYQVEVPFLREPETSNDYSGLVEVVNEVIGKYDSLGMNFTEVCCILPTAPLIDWHDLIDAYALFSQSTADSVIPVVRFHYPVQRGLEILDGKLRFIWPEYEKSRSQDLLVAYHDAGLFYWLSYQDTRSRLSFITEDTIPLILRGAWVQDIDDDEDWEIAERKYQMMRTPLSLSYGQRSDENYQEN